MSVVHLNVVTKLDIDPDRVLTAAVGSMKEVIVIGFDKEDEEYFASSVANGADVLWHLERAKLKLLKLIDET